MHKQIFAFILAAFFTSTALFAQSKDEQAVANAVESLRKAMVDADKAALENLTLDVLTYGHSGGKIENKQTFVENIVNGNSDFVTIELTEQTITVSGKTAIVRHKLSASTNDKGKGTGTVELYVLLVWQKTGKEWKLLARQAVKVPAK